MDSAENRYLIWSNCEDYDDCEYEYCNANPESYLDDEKENLSSVKINGPIICCTRYCYWDGCSDTYSVLKVNNVGELLDCYGNPTTFYVDEDNNLCKKESHTDGSNHFFFRELIDETDFDEEKFYDKIYHQDKGDFMYRLFECTKPIGQKVKDFYGWE